MTEQPADKTSRGRRLGLIGGLGVGATVYYYRELAKAHAVQGRALDLLIAHADMERVFGYVRAGARAGLAEYLVGLIRRLQSGGAQASAIAAVMPHACISELIPLSPLPVINLLEPIAGEITAQGARRVAIFGTRFTIETELFGVLTQVDVVRPRPEEIDFVHDTYYQMAQDGAASEEQRNGLTALAHTLCKRDGVDAILLAGTDLTLVFDERNTDFPHIDCCRLHLRAIRDFLWADASATSTQQK
jgi:aspartate racemase